MAELEIINVDRAINTLSAGCSPGQRVNTGVLFMGAAWFSGSTLLGVMLGAHPSIFYAGEAKKTSYFGNPNAPLKKRACRLCGPSCVVWKNLRMEHGQDLYEVLSRRTARPIVFGPTSAREAQSAVIKAAHRHLSPMPG